MFERDIRIIRVHRTNLLTVAADVIMNVAANYGFGDLFETLETFFQTHLISLRFMTGEISRFVRNQLAEIPVQSFQIMRQNRFRRRNGNVVEMPPDVSRRVIPVRFGYLSFLL